MLKRICGVICFFLLSAPYISSGQTGTCEKERLLIFNGKTSTPIWQRHGHNAFFFRGGMAIDADGAPNAYDPENKRGLDFLRNAGRPGNWWALVTDNGRPNGNPVVQQQGEYKGFYISQTSLRDASKRDDDIAKYVDSRVIPYFVLPKKLMGNGKARLGDLGVVYNIRNKRIAYALFADIGPSTSLGEGSLALAEALGIPTDLRGRKAGQADGVVYLVFPGTANTPAWPGTLVDIQEKAEQDFRGWGGLEMLTACLAGN